MPKTRPIINLISWCLMVLKGGITVGYQVSWNYWNFKKEEKTGVTQKGESAKELHLFITRGRCLCTLGLHYEGRRNTAEHVEPPEGASQYMLLSYSSVDCKRSETSASNKCKVASIYSIVSTGVHSGMWIPKDRWHARSHNHAKPNRLANETNLK